MQKRVRVRKSQAHLQQGVPVCYRFPVIGQHFIPVVSPKTLSVQSCSTHSDDLIVSDPAIQRLLPSTPMFEDKQFHTS